MVKIKCKGCGAVGQKFCTHGKNGVKKFIIHSDKCRRHKKVGVKNG